ncbi:S-adenosyl-L-methionine-dependent methyltransferase [Amanita rubescens]|nr:S-adenosyl-L-methionine-dependent methyltransferase [Amanita rubescens]
MFEQVRQLLNFITKSVDDLEQACIKSNTQLPSLDEPFHPASEAFRDNPAAAEAISVISAATVQLNAIVSPPRNVLYYAVGGHVKSAAIRTCLEGSVTEILREAGPDGLHINEIATKNDLDAQKLASCLRMLATHHIYREVKPNIFANNRISSLLDTSKPSSQTQLVNMMIQMESQPLWELCNLLPGARLDEHFKSSTYFWETVNGSKTDKSGEPADASFSRVIGDGKTYWEWLEQPENAFYQRRFDTSMRGVQALATTAPILSAYNWKSLPPNALVVDVGGGVGTASLVLAREFPDLKIVVQDRQPAIENGVDIWKKELPEALTSSRVQFQAHDFLTVQPQTNASVFFIKNVLHDWSDEYSLKILKQLRDAATPNTKLICMEMMVPYACHESETDEDSADGISGAVHLKAPNPLLANWGVVNDLLYLADIAIPRPNEYEARFYNPRLAGIL